MTSVVTLPLPTIDNLTRLASAIKRSFRLPLTVGLTGELGTGKTTFAQCLYRAYGGTDHVASPTFTLSNEYILPNGQTFVHNDWYRLESTQSVAQLGLEFGAPDTVTVVEWAGKFSDLLPPETIWIQFISYPTKRACVLRLEEATMIQLEKELVGFTMSSQ